MRNLSLGIRLALASAVVTAAVIVVSFMVLRRSTEDNVRRAFIDELGANQLMLQRAQAQSRTLLLQTAAMAARSPTLDAALDAARGSSPTTAAALATVRSEATKILGGGRTGLWIVTDEAGRVIVTNEATDAPMVGTPLADVPIVHNAMSDSAPTPESLLGVHRLGATPLQVGAVPIVAHGTRVGVVLVGEPISLPRGDSIRAVVLTGDSVLASTVDGIGSASRWRPDWVRISDSEPVVTLNGDEYVTFRLPLGLGDDGRQAELFMMRSISAAVDPVLSDLREKFVLVGIVAVLLVGLAGALTSRAALQPLSRFVKFIRAEAGALELAQYDHPGAAAEIRSLTRAYNRLVRAVEAGHDELYQRATELAAANVRLERQLGERVRTDQVSGVALVSRKASSAS